MVKPFVLESLVAAPLWVASLVADVLGVELLLAIGSWVGAVVLTAGSEVVVGELVGLLDGAELLGGSDEVGPLELVGFVALVDGADVTPLGTPFTGPLPAPWPLPFPFPRPFPFPVPFPVPLPPPGAHWLPAFPFASVEAVVEPLWLDDAPAAGPVEVDVDVELAGRLPTTEGLEPAAADTPDVPAACSTDPPRPATAAASRTFPPPPVRFIAAEPLAEDLAAGVLDVVADR